MKGELASPGMEHGIARFAAALKEKGGSLHALEWWQQGACMARLSLRPYSVEDKREMYSLSKSFLSTAFGVAYDRGFLRPEDPATEYFPECRAAAARDERWRSLTLGDLLTMSSGHAACVMPSMASAWDSVEAFFAAPLTYAPGTRFAYNTGASCVAAEAVRRASGESVAALLAKQIFTPLEIDAFAYLPCADGRCQGGTGLSVSCADVAKLGRLYLQGGRWRGQQVLSEAWVAQATTAHIENPGNGSPDWCAGYGYQFWRNARGGFRGDGAFGQLCVVLPERETVVAVAAETTNMASELDALWQLLEAPAQGAGEAADYAPAGTLGIERLDTGWRKLRENEPGIRAFRLTVRAQTVCLQLQTDTGVQTVRGVSGCYTENTLTLPSFRPCIWRQMPRLSPQPLHMAVAPRSEGCDVVLECRSLNVPHAFDLRISQSGDRAALTLESPLDVFGPEKRLESE